MRFNTVINNISNFDPQNILYIILVALNSSSPPGNRICEKGSWCKGRPIWLISINDTDLRHFHMSSILNLYCRDNINFQKWKCSKTNCWEVVFPTFRFGKGRWAVESDHYKHLYKENFFWGGGLEIFFHKKICRIIDISYTSNKCIRDM